MKYRDLVIVRGGGDIASGTIFRLYQAGYKVIVLEARKPTSIRRTVSFSQAVYDGQVEIEGVKSRLCITPDEIEKAFDKYEIPVVVDPKGNLISTYKPKILVDAILAKKNLGTYKNMADIVIGLGPGFTAGEDVDAVIETNRGHNLGRVIYKGKPEKNTGRPGMIEGFTVERVIYSPDEGKIKVLKDIRQLVNKGDIIASVNGKPVVAKISGVIRGMIQEETKVFKGMKIGDIDPRGEKANCSTISDKARAIGGGVLETILHLKL